MVLFEYGTRTVKLPSPVFGDRELVVAEVVVHRALDGTAFAYVSKSATEQVQMRFSSVDRYTVEDLLRFIEYSKGRKVRMIVTKAARHCDAAFVGTWIGQFSSREFSVVDEDVGGSPGTTGAVKDACSFSLEFRGVKTP
jgi:hypothetical protein